VGSVDLGLALGFETQQTFTDKAPVPKRLRSVFPGVSGGVAVKVPGTSVRLGAQGRWQRSVQTLALYAVAADSRVYELEGYAEPRARDFEGRFQRRFTRDGRSIGLSATGELSGFSWVLHADASRAEEELWYNLRIEEPSKDFWTSEGWEGGAALQNRFLQDRLLLTVEMGWSEFDGRAKRLDRFEDENVTGEQGLFEAAAEVRYTLGETWAVAGRIGVDRRIEAMEDPDVFVRSRITAVSRWASASVARRLGGGLWVSAGAGFARYDPSGELPDNQAMGPVYREWIAPALALAGTEASSWTGEVTLSWTRPGGAAAWVRLQTGSTSPTESGEILPLRPSGNRTRWGVTGGVSFF
jgi:hypothetical protein